ncbi:MAG TPA: hypothetical protein VH815_13630, partial [Acidobacteriota bacterium]
GFYKINVFVKKDGTVGRASMRREDEKRNEAEEIIEHTLYCPAKDGVDYLDTEYEFQIWVCG